MGPLGFSAAGSIEIIDAAGCCDANQSVVDAKLFHENGGACANAPPAAEKMKRPAHT
jgi:hypothetical protein